MQKIVALDIRRITVVILALIVAAGSTVAFAASRDIIPIFDVQYSEDPSGDSPLAGQVVTISGIVTGTFNNGYTVADDVGPWNGVFVYTYDSGPALGDEVVLTGEVQEYYDMTEIVDITDFEILSSGNPVTTNVIATGEGGQEAYEGVLLEVHDVSVTGLLTYGEWTINDGSGDLRCDDYNDYTYFPQNGDDLDGVIGPLFYSYGNFLVQPRFTNDISGDLIPHFALGGTVVTMNDTRDILSGVYVEILGDRILAIHDSPPAGLLVVETGGLIFPGLIDSHNHPVYNVLDTIPFGRLYEDRYEWQADPLYDLFKDQYYGMRNYGGNGALSTNMSKMAELRALCAGTTMIQGVNCNGHSYDDFAHQGIFINNVERFPSRALHSTFPLGQSLSYWQSQASQNWNRFIVHLAEGTNTDALDEFYQWQGWGMLDWRTSLIHGVALGAAEWAAMAAADANLIWSPMSNVVLYGETAHIPGALAAGVNVALAPDWTESGTFNILQEMKFARDISDDQWGSLLTAQQLTEFVTRNAAVAIGEMDRVGQVAAGMQADLMIIPGNAGMPYEALLAAESADVMLTVVSGRPMYGDPALMNHFLFLDLEEDVTVGGAPKRIATRIEAFGIPDSDDSYAYISGILQEAYDQAYPEICCFLDIELGSCARAPLAFNDTYAVEQGGSLSVEALGVLANDFDGDGDVLNAVQLSDPSHGSVTLLPDGSFVYEHDGFPGNTDSFTYQANDGNEDSNEATVNIVIAGDPLPVVVSCDADGEEQNEFAPGETVYVKGSGFVAGAGYQIWIQPDPVTEGTAISEGDDPSCDDPGCPEVVNAAGDGSIAVTVVWEIPDDAAAADLAWDIVVDKTGTGQGDYSALDGDGVDSQGGVGFRAPTSDETSVPFSSNRLVVRQNYPNPFNPATVIGFSLPRDMAVEVRVFDLSGRLVRTLISAEILPAGRHEATWNGRDARGRSVSAGVYFYRVVAGSFSEIRRMTLIK